MWRVVVLGLALLVACRSKERLAPEPTPPRGIATARDVAAQDSPSAKPREAAPADKPSARLPTLGDPYGLLSKSAPTKKQAPDPSKLDPGALMPTGPVEPPTRVPLERDARAVARGRGDDRPAPAHITELSASQVMTRVRAGLGRPQVLLLYASYCKACRSVLPGFVELAREYRTRGVGFTAASVDGSIDDFAAYAPVLRGVLEPLWITPDHTTSAELTKLGVPLERSSLYIPLFAVFDRTRRVVAHGYSGEIRTLGSTLDKLL